MIFETSRVRIGLATLGLMLAASGCYSHRTSDEELVDFPDESTDDQTDDGKVRGSRDAGVARQDAAPSPVADAGRQCAGSDPISQLLCSLTPPSPATGGTAQTPALPDLSGLVNSLGGLGNIANVLGTFLGTPTAQQPTTGQPNGLTQLVQLAGGLNNIAQLLNGLQGPNTRSTLPGLFGQPQPQQQPTLGLPSLADVLKQLGIPVLGQQPAVTADPTPNQCTNPTSPVLQFLCALQRTR
ncbi:MAG TPA: hypothetical protein VI299_00520 [Polyangiales bacterium]